MSDNPKLLVVDDEEVICQACRRIFSRQGFQVEVNTDACEGLNCALRDDYAAILLDIKMPKIDGIQFLECLRETKPDQPVLIMTGYPSIPNASAAIRLGASDYVTKPFTPEEITRSVQRIMGARRTKEAEAPTATADEGEPQDPRLEETLFFDESWFRLETRRFGVRRGGVAGSAGRDRQGRAPAADRRNRLSGPAAGRPDGRRQADGRRPLARLGRGCGRERCVGRRARAGDEPIRAGRGGSPASARRGSKRKSSPASRGTSFWSTPTSAPPKPSADVSVRWVAASALRRTTTTPFRRCGTATAACC